MKKWTQEKKHRARQWVINGAVTQDARCKYGRVKENECKLCEVHGTKKHKLYQCEGWKKPEVADGCIGE